MTASNTAKVELVAGGSKLQILADDYASPTDFAAQTRPIELGFLAGRFAAEHDLKLLGDGVRLQPGSVILAETLVLGARSFVGVDATIEAKSVHTGELFFLGPRSRVRCTTIRIGDNAFFPEDADVGGGGVMSLYRHSR